MRRSYKIIAICAAAFVLSPAAYAQDIAVGVNDLLNLRGAMWNAADGTVEDLPSISGSYSVGGGGTISVPLAGSVEVAGKTPNQIAAELEKLMANYSEVGRAPRIAVGVERYAPIYLAGDVERPGVYDFATGMTVIKAIALGGGLERAKPLDGEERNYLQARGAANGLRKELMYLEARRDRLKAEIEQAATLDAPETTDELNSIRGAEIDILTTRNERYAQQHAFLDKSEAALKESISVLEQKLDTNNEQLEAGRAELKREEQLVERGLVPQTRLFDRVRYVSELESRLLDIERSVLTAREDLRNVEEDRLQLEASRAETAVTDLQEVNAKIAEAETKLDAQYALMSEALGENVTLESLDVHAATGPEITVTRNRGGENRAFQAERTTEILPGDVIEIRYPDVLPTYN
ncbi:polysaccharide biosynthesis/export family protein [Qingshengfaniella alkalisoli]|uniref:Uncharacterized protein n=1 Tax=Qingshengfaniella alkalisoli TaxID=2599296 RepID=A0A5B8IBK6_9RHOB|nr:polysaccharide biosynthesis/export family protein [Qingshengfaniella alkalisoli]QDY71619.1 hypothetical protein FPZ52_18300 [Qingshengfaniella alkalisoli]